MTLCIGIAIIIALLGFGVIALDVHDRRVIRKTVQTPTPPAPQRQPRRPPRTSASQRDETHAYFPPPGVRSEQRAEEARRNLTLAAYQDTLRLAEWAREESQRAATSAWQDADRLRYAINDIRASIFEMVKPNRRPTILVAVIVAETALAIVC